jgi:hypothetical protein
VVSGRFLKITLTISAALLAAFVVTRVASVKVHAGEEDSHENLVAIGLRIAPSFINKKGKDLDLVGLGSFIVNGQADCNGCHTSDPASEYLPHNNPISSLLTISLLGTIRPLI